MKKIILVIGFFLGALLFGSFTSDAFAQTCIRSPRSESICIGDYARILTNRTGAYGVIGQVTLFQRDSFHRIWVGVRYLHPRGAMITDLFEPMELQMEQNPGYPPAEIRIGDRVRVISDSYGARNWVGRVVSIQPDYRGVPVYHVEFDRPSTYPIVHVFYRNELELISPPRPSPSFPDPLPVGQEVRILTNRFNNFGAIGRIITVHRNRDSQGRQWYSYAVQYRRFDGAMITNIFERHEIEPVRP